MEVLSKSKMLIKVNCPSSDEIKNIRENSIHVGMLNPSQNKTEINEMLKKK